MTSGSGRPGPVPSVALIHYAAPPVIGGVERVLARHAVLMADAGHEVRVIAGRGRAPDPRVRFVRLPLLDPRHPVIERLQRALDARARSPPTSRRHGDHRRRSCAPRSTASTS